MSWTATTFKAAKPEFGATPDAVVTTALTDAADECDERVFGATYDQAVGLLAAHKLSIAPGGQPARLKGMAPGDTTYLLEWKRLARKKAGGPMVTGRSITGDPL